MVRGKGWYGERGRMIEDRGGTGWDEVRGVYEVRGRMR